MRWRRREERERERDVNRYGRLPKKDDDKGIISVGMCIVTVDWVICFRSVQGCVCVCVCYPLVCAD